MDLSVLKNDILKKLAIDADNDILKNIQSMSELIDSTIGLMRRLVRELRPEILDELGLVEALRWYVKEIEKRTYLKFQMTVFPKNMNTDTKRSITLFRVFQEILINIARHSKATNVNIYLRKKNGMINLLVHDNGIGIKQEEIINKKSFGILGMRERVLVFGGKLDVSGSPGKGTTIKVEIPVL
jgi:signal transduction histidine kinase